MADSQRQDSASSLSRADQKVLDERASQSMEPALERDTIRSPTDENRLYDSVYCPQSPKERSPTETGTTSDFPTSPSSVDSLQKPHLDAASAEINSQETNTPHLSKPFRIAQTILRKVGAFRIHSVRRVWSEVADRAPDTLSDQISYAKPTWKTTIIRFGPLSGILCMLGAISTMIASLGILVGSNGQAVGSWSAPPSTYLAVFTAVANLGMRYACMQGVVIAWWVRALRGSTFAQLHHDWRSGTTLRGALTAGRHMGLLGLACIFSTLVVIDGPLLQRSSTVTVGQITHDSVPLNVSMVPELPNGWSGAWVNGEELGLEKFYN